MLAPGTDLNEMAIFAAIVEHPSLTAAARALGLPKSTVSRKLQELETRLGARLLQRSTRALHLTELGRSYYVHCAHIVEEAQRAEQLVRRLQQAPSGRLRLTAPLAFAVLAPVLAEYLEAHPQVQLDVRITDEVLDLLRERLDVAIRLGPVPDSSLHARRLGEVRRVLVAAPRWLERHGAPADLDALRTLDTVCFRPDKGRWSLEREGRRQELTLRPRLQSNDYELLLASAVHGAGIALLPEYLCAPALRAGALVRLLPAYCSTPIAATAVYPSAAHLTPALEALLDWLARRLLPAIAAAPSALEPPPTAPRRSARPSVPHTRQ